MGIQLLRPNREGHLSERYPPAGCPGESGCDQPTGGNGADARTTGWTTNVCTTGGRTWDGWTADWSTAVVCTTDGCSTDGCSTDGCGACEAALSSSGSGSSIRMLRQV